MKLESEHRVIDVAGWVGQYPFRQIRVPNLDELVTKLAALNIERAIIAPFEGVFAENNLDAYAWWAERATKNSTIELWPVLRPGQLQGVEKLLDRYAPRGLRLTPNYHGYRLSDPSVEPIMQMARERNMIVQVFARIADERWHYMLKVPGVENQDFEYFTSKFGDQRILISGLNSIAFLAPRLRDLPHLYADLSRIRGPQFAIEKLVIDLLAKKLVFGSLWPIQIIEATLWQVTTASIPDAMKNDLLYANAQRLLANESALV